MKKSGAPIPCVMDGEKRFKSRREAARWIVEQTGVATDAHTIANNICTVISNGRGTVYGHTFADDVTPLTPHEMESLIERQRAALIGMHRQMEICALRGKAPTAAMVDRWTRRLRDECGVEA